MTEKYLLQVDFTLRLLL